MSTSNSIPELLEDEIDALIDAGCYSNKEDAIKDAIRTLMETKSNLRLIASIEMYKKEKVSLGRAAELADMSVVEFKEVLISRDIDRKLYVDADDLRKSDEVINYKGIIDANYCS